MALIAASHWMLTKSFIRWSCPSNIRDSASVPTQLEVGFIKTGRFLRLQLPVSPWRPVSGVIEEQSQRWGDSACCKSGKQAARLSSRRRSHRWKCHHKALLTWIPDSQQRSDPAVNLPVSVANRRPPENGKMFETLLLDSAALHERSWFPLPPLCAEAAQT